MKKNCVARNATSVLFCVTTILIISSLLFLPPTVFVTSSHQQSSFITLNNHHHNHNNGVSTTTESSTIQYSSNLRRNNKSNLRFLEEEPPPGGGGEATVVVVLDDTNQESSPDTNQEQPPDDDDGEEESTAAALETNQEEICTESCCQQFQVDCPDEIIISNATDTEAEADAITAALRKLPNSVQILMIVFLLLQSALFSGLTLGLMSLDCTGLEIVMEGDNVQNATYAKKIYPVRKNGNLLLCTLLLGNVAVNSLLSILLADKAGGTVGLLVSTFLIVIFGEIVPQAACSRYALMIGAFTVPLVQLIVFLLYPAAKPLSMALDWILGAELARTYSSSEMLKLLQIHVQEKKLDPDTAVAMTGALQYKDITVKEVMTPLENTFMLSVNERLNFETIAKIFKTGYSRIPVYEISKNNVIGLLFVKDLIFIDPEDETRLADFIDIFGRALHVVWPDEKLGDVLRELKQGRSHMAIVRDVNNADETQDPFYEIRGIITLEDIVEEILGDEIVDETDAFLDGTHAVKVDRTEAFQWARLRLLHSKIVDATLSFDETRAVVAHLSKNYASVVSALTENQLFRLIAETPVAFLSKAEQDVGQKLPADLLYERNVVTDVCTLVLSGKVTVLAGRDEFRSDVASWGLLAPGALETETYRSDFTAFVSGGPSKCLRLTRAQFVSAVNESVYERQNKNNVDVGDGGGGGGHSKYIRRMSNSHRTSSERSCNKFIDTDKSHKVESSISSTSDKPTAEVVDLPSSPTVSFEVEETSEKKELIAATHNSKSMEALQCTPPRQNDSKDSQSLGLLGASTSPPLSTQTGSESEEIPFFDCEPVLSTEGNNKGDKTEETIVFVEEESGATSGGISEGQNCATSSSPLKKFLSSLAFEDDDNADGSVASF